MQQTETADRTERIRQLNDQLRRSFVGGVVMITPGIEALARDLRAKLLRRVRIFDQFDENNDPHQEHDFGSFEFAGETIFWKIDYYDLTVKQGTTDPSNPAETTRILTIMLASEY